MFLSRIQIDFFPYTLPNAVFRFIAHVPEKAYPQSLEKGTFFGGGRRDSRALRALARP